MLCITKWSRFTRYVSNFEQQVVVHRLLISLFPPHFLQGLPRYATHLAAVHLHMDVIRYMEKDEMLVWLKSDFLDTLQRLVVFDDCDIPTLQPTWLRYMIAVTETLDKFRHDASGEMHHKRFSMTCCLQAWWNSSATRQLTETACRELNRRNPNKIALDDVTGSSPTFYFLYADVPSMLTYSVRLIPQANTFTSS